MPDYNALRATALRLIQTFGSLGDAQITRRVPGVYDPLTDTDAGETFITTAVSCVVLPASDAEQSARFNDLSITDSLIMYLPSSYTPEVGDTVVIPQQVQQFTLTQFQTVAPDGNPIYSKCRLERTAA